MYMNTVHDQNKADVLINAHPFFGADFKLFFIVDQIEVNICRVNSNILPTFLAYSPLPFYKALRLTRSIRDCPSLIGYSCQRQK